LRSVYLDNASTTPVHPEVVKAMLPYLETHFGNPQSLHDFGEEPRDAITTARQKVAGLIGAQPEELIFTASGSEANNLVLKGIAQAYQKKGNHLVVSTIEHFSVLHSVKTLTKAGFEVTEVAVDQHGLVDSAEIARAIKPETVLVSVMLANNEIGTIEPVSEIAKVCHEKEVIFHTDAVAAAGNIPIDVNELGVSALSLAGNQFYGPKGAAALYLRKGTRLTPQIDGGIQEEGKRAGTENVPAIVGLGRAAEIAGREMGDRSKQLQLLRDKLASGLTSKIEETILTGHPEKRLPGHASICIKFVEGESMLMMLNMEGIAASSGSACTSRALKASHVLLAIGISHEVAHGSLVFTLGTDITSEDIDYVLEKLPPIVDRLRQMSPLYQKYKSSQT